ncbi:MAG: hypothetical protein AAFQ44_05430 [Pseudomonadota bacterium]
MRFLFFTGLKRGSMGTNAFQVDRKPLSPFQRHAPVPTDKSAAAIDHQT